MTIIQPTPTEPEDFFSLPQVVIATIPLDFTVQVESGKITILSATLKGGKLQHRDIIFPNTTRADIIMVDEENKFIIIRL